MNAFANIHTGLVSALLGFATLFIGQAAFGQSSSQSQSNAIREGEVDSSPTPKPQTDGEPEPDTPKTIYSKYGKEQSGPMNPYGTVHRSKITYGKRVEMMEVKESSGPGRIQKTKDGSSDASVPTGKFKESLLDIGLPSAPVPAPSPALNPSATPKASPAVRERFSSSPSSSPEPASALKPVTAPELDITLGAGPAAAATATPGR